jgi:hypothetical protein
MNAVVKFIIDYNDTDTNEDDHGSLIIEAYDLDGNLIDVYPDPESEIDFYFERKYRKENENDLTGRELVLEEFYGNYHQAFKGIKEDLAP